MRKFFPLALGLLLLTAPLATAQEPDIVIADFEGDTYGDWTVEGTAFGSGPATAEGRLADHGVQGYEGNGAIHTMPGEDSELGKITSPEFTLDRPYINFLIGGGDHYRQVGIDLVVDGEVVRTSSGIEREQLLWNTWDVTEFAGKKAHLVVYDNISSGWGHINVDSITLSETPKIHLYPNAHINQAMAALLHDHNNNKDDSWRPTYHYLPPSGWMNDVNGAFYQDGWYHCFYQLTAFHGNFGATIGWGHARSRDLVNWERMPLAVWPRQDLGERACWSGGMGFAADGTPVLMYTSVPLNGTADAFVQNAAVPLDEDMAIWDWHPDNPTIAYREQGEPEFATNWRDPFAFKVGDRTMMVVGGTNQGVPFYEATDDDLGTWEYKGIGFAKDAECPNFFQLDGKWVLLSSAYGDGVVYYVGDFDPDKPEFTPELEGVLDEHKGFNSVYGTGVLFDEQDRCIFLARIRGGHNGWDGYLCLPRVLTLGDDGRPRQQPVPELEQLRGEHHEVTDLELTDGSMVVLEGIEGENLEILAEFEAGDAEQFGLHIRRADDGSRSVAVWYDNGTLDVQGIRFPYELEEGDKVTMHLYNDRIVLEVFFGDGEHVVSRAVFPPEADLQVAAFAKGGTATLRRLDAWNLNPAPIEVYPTIAE